MVKSRKKPKTIAAYSDRTKERLQENANHAKEEMLKQIEAYRENAAALIVALEEEMHKVLRNLPKEIAEMTVEEYIQAYLEKASQKVDTDDELLPDVSCAPASVPMPSGAIFESVSSAPMPAPTTSKRAKTKRKAPTTTATRMSTRIKQMNQNTPSVSKVSMKLVKGTPFLSRSDARYPNLTNKPREMRETDTISSLQINMFSDKGSPMLVASEGMSEHMKLKIQDQLRSLMEETQ